LVTLCHSDGRPFWALTVEWKLSYATEVGHSLIQREKYGLDTRENASRVEKLLRHAHDEMRISGVPLFVIGDRVLIGLQSKEV